MIDCERKSRAQDEHASGEEVDGGSERHERVHVNEHKPAVSRLVGHEIDKRLDGARLKIGF